ncbi:hypothetical protein [Frondihabitans cladoniiphilus]|uniref:Beta/gamma crystallin 'Greek key' domain-containing protein n=1 Tax=Frondihabitans cladoniiphilus TaxID=715785 RepID=A0ABP8W2M6_9MICO
MKKIIPVAAATTLAAAIAVGTAAPASAGIVLYQYNDYSTSLGDFGRGTTFVGSHANDKASSIRVGAPANYAILYQHRDRGGDSRRFAAGSPNLASWNFDNMTSSIG